MEPTASPPPEPDASAPAPPGALVVLNGRLSGSRCALSGPLTLIGRAEECDVRLNVEGVAPLHSAILSHGRGFLLRDLGSTGGTRVNGSTVGTCPLRHGDVIGVGPFQFRVEFADPEAAEPLPDPAALEAERDALRIQAAAVAAQQAQLTEDESRLLQRRTALERQEEQLAAHLDERRQRLLALQEEVRQERSAFRTEAEGARRQNEELRQELTQVRQQAERERRRLVELRKRLRRRWQRHWQGHEAALRRQEQELSGGREQLQREAAELQRERARLAQAQLRFNGEAELGRRQLREEWQQLALAQQQWEACLNQEHAERGRRLRDLEERVAALASAEQTLAEQKRSWQQTHAKLQKELSGLETRVQNQRHKLTEQEQQLARLGATVPGCGAGEPPPPAPLALGEERRPAPAVLQQLADDLADQRLHLLEQWQRLLQVLEHWRQECAAVSAELEAAGQQLGQREQRLLAREEALAAGGAELVRRQEVLAQVRCYLEGWQVRLTAREGAWEGERAVLLAEVRGREEAAAARARRLEELRQRWGKRRRQEVEELRAAWAQCEELRRSSALLWHDCQQRQAALAEAQRQLAAQSLALERFRQECLARSPNAAAAEKRLERLRRSDLERIEAEEHDLERARQALRAEAVRLDERARRLREQEESLIARHEDWSRRQLEWESRHGAAEDAELRHQQELQCLRARHAQDELQLRQLREEVERIARLLLDEGEPVTPPANQAA